MASKTFTAAEAGMKGAVVEVECHGSNGLPGVVIVGMASKTVDEAKERLRSAFSSSGLQFPKKRLTLNLAPADLPKESASMDLAMAGSIILSQTDSKPKQGINKTVLYGELSLDGTIRPVRGIIGKLLAAKHHGFTDVLLPAANSDQAGLVEGLQIHVIKHLRELPGWLFENLDLTLNVKPFTPDKVDESDDDFSTVVGHTLAKRALEIAASGGHNLLMNGPPGSGKSMLAKAFRTILPPLTKSEILEATHIHSLVGSSYDSVITTPPFRAPHHTASSAAIIGGGQQAKPGEISMSHRGVLFLDELPEYRRDCLEALRQPLEDKEVSVSRAKQSVIFPADFVLIATKNPCPCGHHGTKKACRCSAYDILRYNKKLSGPIMDRIDIHTEVEEIPYSLLGEKDHVETASSAIRSRVVTAREIQRKRNPKAVLNAKLTNKNFHELNTVSTEARDFLATAAEKLGISARSFVRTLRIAQTIADMEASPQISKQHIAEALQFRPKSMEII